MTAQELIKKLQELPPDTRVLISGYDDGFCDTTRMTEIKSFRERSDPQWYCGAYLTEGDYNWDITKPETEFKGIVLL